MDATRIPPGGRWGRGVDGLEPTELDEAADQRAGHRLVHRPARCDAIGRAAFAVALEQDALGGGDKQAVNARRTGEEAVDGTGERGVRRRRGIDCGAKRPGAIRGGCALDGGGGDVRGQCGTRDDAAPAQRGGRSADDRRAERRIGPGNPHGARRGVGGEGDRACGLGCLQAGAARLAVGHGVKPAGHGNAAPAQAPQRLLPAEIADECHIDQPLGREIHFAQPQRRLGDLLDQRRRQAGSPRHERDSRIERSLAAGGRSPITMERRGSAGLHFVGHGASCVSSG